MRFDEEPRGEHDVDLPPIAPRRAQPMTTAIFSTARLALMRMARNPWLLSVVAIGVIAIDILACTAPLYLRLISSSQLQTAIAQASAPTRNMQVYVRSDATNAAIRQWAATHVEAQARQNLASFSEGTPLRYTQSDVLGLMQAGSYTYNWADYWGAPQNAQLDSFDFAAIAPHMRLLEGRLPETAPAGQPTQTLITQEMAEDLGLHVGQRIAITSIQKVRPNTGLAPVPLLITGIWAPLSDIDPFWNGLRFRSTTRPFQTYPPPLWPLLTTEASLYTTLGALPHVGATQNWVYYVDPAHVTTSSSAAITDDLTTFRVQFANTLNAKSGEVQGGTRGHLEQIIQQTQSQLNFLSLPLSMIALLIIGLALLFVAAMARLLVTAQEQEIVTLKSRGASSPQLLGVFTAQSIPAGVLATVSAPLLAVGVSLLLVRAFLPGTAADLSSLTSISALSGEPASLATLAQSAGRVLPIIIPAIVGSILGVGVVIGSGFSVARLDVLAFRRELARPTHVPVWRRYHLDLALVVLCVVGYLELSQFGNTQTRLQLTALNAQTQTQSSGASTSLLLLVAPALLLVAGGLLLLRLVPLAARFGTWPASRGRGLAALLALAQIERTPARYARMILLLALAVGLGCFALTFDASLAQNTRDRAAFATGADIRLQTTPTVGEQEASDYSAHLRTLSGVQAVSGVYRTNASMLVDRGLQGVDMLGVDPSTFAAVTESTSWRTDYAAQSLPALMAQLRAHQSNLEAGSQAHPMWAIVSETLARQSRLNVGDRFQAIISDISYTSTSFVVGAIIMEFPTLYPNSAPGGFMVLDVHDLDGAISAHALANNSLPGGAAGVNEFWLRTTGDLASDRALLQTLRSHAANFSLTATLSLREELAQAAANPVNGGMRGLLLLGAFVAALLAVVGSVTQAVLAARQRTRPFAVLRTLGLARYQLTGVLLREQLVVYLFGLVGGTVLGLILMSATVPYLQFSDSLIDPSTVGVPAYLLRINWPLTGVFYGALLVAFVLALVVTARFAATLGLGKTLRIGED